VRALYLLLETSQAKLSIETRQTLRRVTDFLLAVVHPDQVLTVFLALRHYRVNHKHTRRAILNYLLNHPQLEDLALRRRSAVVDSLEHALGRNVARGAVKELSASEQTRYAERQLLRFSRQPEQVQAILPFL